MAFADQQDTALSSRTYQRFGRGKDGGRNDYEERRSTIFENIEQFSILPSDQALLLLTQEELKVLPTVANTFFSASTNPKGKSVEVQRAVDVKVIELPSASIKSGFDQIEHIIARKISIEDLEIRKSNWTTTRPLSRFIHHENVEDIDQNISGARMNRLSMLWDNIAIETDVTPPASEMIQTTVKGPISTYVNPVNLNVRVNAELNSLAPDQANIDKSEQSSARMISATQVYQGLYSSSKPPSSKNEVEELSVRVSPPILKFSTIPNYIPPPPPPPMMLNSIPPPPPCLVITNSIPPPPPLPVITNSIPLAPLPPPFPTSKSITTLNDTRPSKFIATQKPEGDLQSELMNMLKNPNLRGGLRKVAPKLRSAEESPKLSKEELLEVEATKLEQSNSKRLQDIAEERQNLIVEMLGFMQTPNGSIDDLLDKCIKSTSTSRGFIYTLVRRNWIKAFRVKISFDQNCLAKGKKFKHVPCTVFPGREWTSAIELPDLSKEELLVKYEHSEYVGCAHMYRFDHNTLQHITDEILFYKDAAYPPKLIPFTKAEPPQDNNLENRNKWEVWSRKKLAHQQSDAAQFDLIYNKLITYDQILTNSFVQLQGTITQIRAMNDAVSSTFQDIPIDDLRILVASIPAQIKNVAKEIHDTNGIIIKDTDLKLTPAFLKTLSIATSPTKTTSTSAHSATLEQKLEMMEGSAKSRDSLGSVNGLNNETTTPMFQSLNSKGEAADKKALRRYTLWL